MRESYIVTVNRPKGVTVVRMRIYIANAIGCYNGALPPSDPLYKGVGKIKVVRMPKPPAEVPA